MKKCVAIENGVVIEKSEGKDNIFENAYLGKPYKTRDGRKAIYIRDFICNGINHLVTTGDLEFSVNGEGKVDNNLYQFGVDIVSEWEEEINENKLEELAKSFNITVYKDACSDEYWNNFLNLVEEAYKEGCRSVKKNLL